MFARTDFPHRKLMLRESILEMLMFAQTGTGQAEIQRLGKRHRQLHVRSVHYELWLDALCEALAIHTLSSPPALEQKWRAVMVRGIEIMSDSGDQPAFKNSSSENRSS
jgi:hypothetical protein